MRKSDGRHLKVVGENEPPPTITDPAFPPLNSWYLPQPSQPVRPAKTSQPPKPKRGHRRGDAKFTLGPIPLSWQVACNNAGPNCLLLAQAILMRIGSALRSADDKDAVVSHELGQELGLTRRQRYRALAALETAGLVEIAQEGKRAPRVRLLPNFRPCAPTRRLLRGPADGRARCRQAPEEAYRG